MLGLLPELPHKGLRSDPIIYFPERHHVIPYGVVTDKAVQFDHSLHNKCIKAHPNIANLAHGQVECKTNMTEDEFRPVGQHEPSTGGVQLADFCFHSPSVGVPLPILKPFIQQFIHLWTKVTTQMIHQVVTSCVDVFCRVAQPPQINLAEIYRMHSVRQRNTPFLHLSFNTVPYNIIFHSNVQH